jgi:hypothetical protein
LREDVGGEGVEDVGQELLILCHPSLMLRVGDDALVAVLVDDLHGGWRLLGRAIEDWHKIGSTDGGHDLRFP